MPAITSEARRVYPRVCGGTIGSPGRISTFRGLSPRVRGNRCRDPAGSASPRSIPACAGEPTLPVTLPLNPRVYPRVCGGTTVSSRVTSTQRGLSPRVRGNRVDARPDLGNLGSIPACAGEPSEAGHSKITKWVYPRVCGGTDPGGTRTRSTRGLSPRVRGNPRPPRCLPSCCGSIPACAGEPISCARPSIYSEVYPRVCGGTHPTKAGLPNGMGLSPRVRGNPKRPSIPSIGDGSIPACAGEPRVSSPRSEHSRVYPRVCGGTFSWAMNSSRRAGLSPRVRGNRMDRSRHSLRPRSIPACAGEPGG